MACEHHHCAATRWQSTPINNATWVSERFRRGVAFTVCFVWTLMVQGQSSNPCCTVDVSRPGAEVAAVCRGQQIEEFNHQFQGGLYAQFIQNPSFEELNNPIAEWFW